MGYAEEIFSKIDWGFDEIEVVVKFLGPGEGIPEYSGRAQFGILEEDNYLMINDDKLRRDCNQAEVPVSIPVLVVLDEEKAIDGYVIERTATCKDALPITLILLKKLL